MNKERFVIHESIAIPKGLSNLEMFEESKVLLETALKQIEICYACAVMLKLEHIFKVFPWVASIECQPDYEGWHISEAIISLPDGSLEKVGDVIRMFEYEYEDKYEYEDENGSSGLTESLKKYHERCIVKNKIMRSFFQEKDIKEFNKCVLLLEEALSLFNQNAKSLFLRTYNEKGKITVYPGKSEKIAGDLGLNEVAAALTCQKIAEEMPKDLLRYNSPRI